MKRVVVAFLIFSCACHTAATTTDVSPARPGIAASSTTPIASSLILADVQYLADTTLRGRAVGTIGNAKAAAYIVEQYRGLGLTGAFEHCRTAVTCISTYFQDFEVNAIAARNIGAIVEGSDSTLRKQFVVIGAHYDHIGTSAALSRDPKLGSVVRPGADDNASGSAAVLELARRLKAHPPRRSVLVLNFDAEERGLLGSANFVRHLPVPRSSMVLMVNFDMVGRLRKNELTVDKSVLGLGETRVLEVLDSTAKSYGVTIKFTSDIDGRSDHTSFEHVVVPALALFTGFHDDYHSATDVVAKLNVPGISRVVDIAESVVRASANRDKVHEQ